MSKQNVEIRHKLYNNGKAIEPFIPDLVFTDAITTGFNLVSISASASDETVNISDLGTIVDLELRVLAADVDKITVKYNGSSDAYAVSPIDAVSENITAITASNSSAAAVDLFYKAVYQ